MVTIYHRRLERYSMSDMLATVTTSKKRKRLIILLLRGPRTLLEIKQMLNVTATGMLPQIRILEEAGVIVKEDGCFQLTEIGQIAAHYLEQFDRTLAVLEEKKKFWQEHDILALPREFILRMGDLNKTRLLEARFEDSFDPHTEFLDMILQSNRVAGIVPIIHPKYPQFFLELAKKGMNVQIILTKNAFDKIHNEYFDTLQKGLQYENARLFICDEGIRFAHIITDRYFFISLSLKNGMFDPTKDIVSSESSAIKFGEDLFTYYQVRSRKVKTDGTY